MQKPHAARAESADRDADGVIIERLHLAVSYRTLYFQAYTYLSQALFLAGTGVIGRAELHRRHAVLTELVGVNLNRIAKLTALRPPASGGEGTPPG